MVAGGNHVLAHREDPASGEELVSQDPGVAQTVPGQGIESLHLAFTVARMATDAPEPRASQQASTMTRAASADGASTSRPWSR